MLTSLNANRLEWELVCQDPHGPFFFLIETLVSIFLGEPPILIIPWTPSEFFFGNFHRATPPPPVSVLMVDR